MTYTLNRTAPVRTALIGALIYACISLLFVPFFLIFGLLGGEGFVFGILMAIFFPVIYAVFGFITVVVMCVLYNVIVTYTGGIEMDLVTNRPDTAWESSEESWQPRE